jgi:hypothetical protein
LTLLCSSRNPIIIQLAVGIIAGFILLIAGFINMNMHFQTGKNLRLGGYKGTAFMEILKLRFKPEICETIVQVRSSKLMGYGKTSSKDPGLF